MPKHNTVSDAAAEAARQACHTMADADPVGQFQSAKNGRRIPIWSPADRRFCALAEASTKIAAFQERPDLLILSDRGHVVPFVVDFQVTMQNGRIALIGLSLLETTMPDPAEARLLAIARAHCARRGIVFVHLRDKVDVPCRASF